jgi:hypothetical protein
MTTRANTTAHSQWSTAPDKSFITTQPFHTELYSYSVSRSDRPPYTTTGVLVLNKSATPGQCPAGRVLHANGKRLIPDVNVMNSFTVPTANTIQEKKFMLGVYDPVSMLNGYIDPTSATFAVYDKNRPASDYLLNATGATSEALSLLGLGGQGSRLPAKILIGNPGTVVAAGASSVGSFSAAININNVSSTELLVSTTSVTPNSIILLTCNATFLIVSLGTITSGVGFSVNFSTSRSLGVNQTVIVNWLIIN